MLHRLRTDFHLALVTLFSACAVVFLTPFAIYRLATGAVLPGAITLGLVLLSIPAVVVAWRTGRTRGPAIVISLVYSTGVVVQSLLLGLAGVLWIYPTLLANFLLVRRTLALTLSTCAVLIVTWQGAAFETTLHRFVFVATAGLASMFALIFASRTELQRRQLELLATLDALTGIPNRRAMEQELVIAVESCRRHSSIFGLLLIDLDRFKRVNDRFGHEAGDRVLIQFSRIVRSRTRAVDRLFRLGGEEFVLLTSGTATAELHRLAEKLRKNVASELTSPDGAVTVSIGATVLQPNEDWPSWLRRADRALYRAKESGRNQVVIEGD